MKKLIQTSMNISICLSSLTAYASGNKELLFVKQFIQPQGLVFDVGAHKGAKTDLYLAQHAQVVCIEPQPACVELLMRKYQFNPQVQIVSQGLAEAPGSMELYICSDSPTISTFSEEWQHGRFENYNWDKKVTVPVTTLDALIAEFGVPCFCKIDVEGFEYIVLKGLSQPIAYISFEFTKELFKNSKLCLQHLKNLGYTNFNYALGETPALVHHQWISAEQLITEIEKHPDHLLWGDIYAHYEKNTI